MSKDQMDRPKTAVIVAAGRSSRLYPLTEGLPKCLLDVGSRSMIARSLDSLKAGGIDRIYVVVGYCREKIQQNLNGSVEFIHNPYYASCNNMGSLWFAHPQVSGRPFVYMHADLVYHPDLLVRMLEAPQKPGRLLVDFRTLAGVGQLAAEASQRVDQ